MLFEGGERLGHLCLVLSDAAYGEKIMNPNWSWEDNVPEEPTPCNPDITDEMGDVERRSMEAEWENHKALVTTYNLVQECLVDRIAGACDKEPYLEDLWDEYAQFNERTAREMIDHIMGQVRQKLTSNTPTIKVR